MPRPVIFDLFNTLVAGADDERDLVLGRMALAVGVAPAELIAEYRATWPDRLIGRWDVEQTVRILARRLGGTPSEEQVRQAAASRRALARRLLDTVSEATLDVLDMLRADGHPLALVSNATSDVAHAWPQGRLAGRFDVAVFSCEVGFAKPDPAIYRIAADRLGVDPAECVFVGDGADGELAGAAALDMAAYRTTEHADSDPGWGGPVFAALGDLPALLSEWYPVPRRPIGSFPTTGVAEAPA